MKKKCTTKYCQKPAAKGHRVCHSCAKRAYAAKHKEAYSYHVLRNNAKRRKKVFELTLDEFKEFAYETNLLQGRGRTSTSWHIDRKEDEKGYTRSNIQVLPNADNVRKEHERRRREKLLHYDHQSDRGWWTEPGRYKAIGATIITTTDENCPF